MNRSLSIFILLGILTIVPGRLGWAALNKFIPKYVDYSADIGIRGLYESDSTTSDKNSYKRKKLTFQEGLGMAGLGYIYSPLFISMKTSVSFGLKQERLSRDDTTEEKYGDANQFKHVFKILPSHPYNLELYGLRSTPMTSGGGQTTMVINEYGANALYERRPWNSSLTYTNRKIRSERTSENDSFIFTTHYFETLLGVSAACLYANNETDTIRSLARNENSSFNFSKKFKSAYFYTGWSKTKSNQDSKLNSSPQSSHFDQQQWNNELRLDLPQNFSSLLYYNIKDSKTGQKGEFLTTEFSNYSEQYSFKLNHRLYTSLSTGFAYSHNYIESNSGRSTMERSKLNGSYSKKIPWGHLLGSLSGGVSFNDNKGSTRSFSQPYSVSSLASPPNSFTLNFPLIDRDSIIVRIIDLAPNEQNKIVLREELNEYSIEDIAGGFFRIRINPAATMVADLVSPGGLIEEYGYEVDFALIPSDYELRTITRNGRLALPLFNTLITPFYSYSDSEQTIMDGNYPALANQSKTHTLGLEFQYDPFRAEIIYSRLRATTISDDRLNTLLEYSNQLTPFTSSRLTLAYEKANTEDKAEVGFSHEQQETLYSIQANLQTIWPQNNITGSITGNYSSYKGSGETNTYSFFSVLSWHIGQMDLDLTATYTDSESSFAGVTTKDDYTMVRFDFKRELF